LAAAPWALPFHGKARSCQLLGLGSWAAAAALPHPVGFRPLAFAGHALVQLAFFDWRESPVGPYCASYAGIVLANAAGNPGRRRETQTSPRRAPDAAAVLAAFAGAPPVLSIPTYVVGDAPDGPRGCGAHSKEYGRAVLGMDKSDGRFAFSAEGETLRLQCLEETTSSDERTTTTGYSFTCTIPRRRHALDLPVPPRLMTAPLLRQAMSTVLHGGEQAGGLFVPDVSRRDEAVLLTTRYTSRPRVVDLSADPKACFAPLVLDRPAPERALGRILENLQFAPLVLAWDAELRGSIVETSAGPRES
jgi:hypothetical protein